MRLRYIFLLAVACASFMPYGFAQVATYTFSSFIGTYTSIVGQSGTVVVSTQSDDQSFGTYPIGFTFSYNNNEYTTFGINANGFIAMGAVPIDSHHPLSSGLSNNVISAFTADLYGLSANGAQLCYQTSGTAPNRVLTIEWANWGFFSTGLNEFNFQIKLFEGSNKIQFVYGPCPGSTSKTLQVGLRGHSNADFNNRTTTTNWEATTAGTTYSASCTFNATVKPSSGLTFEWTPPPPSPRTLNSITAAQITGNVAPNTDNNAILKLTVTASGGLGYLTLNSIVVTSKNTNDADVKPGGVKIWLGNSSTITTLISSGASFSGGKATVSGINFNIPSGTNYLYVTYDAAATAVAGNTLDARIVVGDISITASGGANNPGTQPTTALNPNGSRTVGYCTPVSESGGCGGDKITGFVFAGINYSTNSCVNSPGYLDVGTTATVVQAQEYSITINNGDPDDYVAVWIDFNDNTSFDDAGELVFTGGPGTSVTGMVTIPLTAPAGTHRLRVRNNFDAPVPSSCGPVEFGETKDFRVTVIAAVNCSGTPATATTLSTTANACEGIPFTLSLSITYVDLGITYQWQQSADGVNFSNINGATNKTFTTTQTSTSWYRCRVTCSNSGLSSHSTALHVPQNPFTVCYCIPPPGNCNGGDRINNVTFAGINNTTTCSPNAYGDYTSLVAEVTAGTVVPISVAVSYGGTQYVSVWIDYNHNAVFEASEKTFIGSAFNATIYSNISIPSTALSGITRMRVRCRFAYEPPDACAYVEDGETEDYFVNIACVPTTWYADSDGDGFGNASVTLSACTQPAGYVSNSSDCNDANASIHPNATDVCNGVDDNCNSVVDDFAFTATVTPSGTVTICDGSSVLLTAIPNGTGYTYQWIKGSKNLNGATNATYSAKKDANYKVTITYSAYGCSSTSAATNIDLLPKPTATITPLGNLDICGTGSVVLQANGGTGLTYQWRKGSNPIEGATNQTYTATATGTYKVVVTNSHGCSKTSSGVTVTKSCKLDGDADVAPVVWLHPNPVHDRQVMVQVRALDDEKQLEISLYNAVGMCLLRQEVPVVDGQLSHQLALPNLSAGVYMVSLQGMRYAVTYRLIVSQ